LPTPARVMSPRVRSSVGDAHVEDSDNNRGQASLVKRRRRRRTESEQARRAAAKAVAAQVDAADSCDRRSPSPQPPNRKKRKCQRSRSPSAGPGTDTRRSDGRPADSGEPSGEPREAGDPPPPGERAASKWVCRTCGGAHRTKDCPLAKSTAAGIAPSLGPMGMMDPLGVMGMLPAGMMPMAGMGPTGMLERQCSDRSSSGRSYSASSGSFGSESRSRAAPAKRRRRRRSRSRRDRRRRRHVDARKECRRDSRRQEPRRATATGRRKAPIPAPGTPLSDVERFLGENHINDEAGDKIRALSPDAQRRVIARPLTGDVQNPSKVMIARVREVKQQEERLRTQALCGPAAMMNAWPGAMGGPMAAFVEKFIEDNDLDDSASRELRSLPPQQQGIALSWDLSGFRNPSAKFMSMANGLSMPQRTQFGMPGMGMPPMGMGMPGMMPPMMPGFPHPGMMPPMMPGMMPPMPMPPPMQQQRMIHPPHHQGMMMQPHGSRAPMPLHSPFGGLDGPSMEEL